MRDNASGSKRRLQVAPLHLARTIFIVAALTVASGTSAAEASPIRVILEEELARLENC